MPILPLCGLDDIEDGAARSIAPDNSNPIRSLILWRRGAMIASFANACPHLGPPLETFPDRLLNQSRTHLVCSAHGALFEFSGRCSFGPCENQSLKPLAILVRDGIIYVDTDDPSYRDAWPD